MAYCKLCGKDRQLINHPPFYGMLSDESDKRVQICRVCAVKWKDNQTKPYTALMENEIWGTHPNNALEAVVGPLRRMNYMIRFGAEVNTNPESLAEHSFWVQMIAFHIAQHYKLEVDYGKLAWYAMFHDVAEIMTGDIPTPLKTETIKEEADRLESLAAEKFQSWGIDTERFVGYNHRDTTDLESRITKCADFISSIVYSTEEALIGNLSMKEVKARTFKKFRRFVQLDWEKDLYQAILVMSDRID